ncbi:CvpA family protein [Pseudoteredinibacter isoporae]|uniref:CvpA family protein n=1 Tax=Pseudoteredinibacter isoporae TaxID=570281 RepID=UPI0031086013
MGPFSIVLFVSLIVGLMIGWRSGWLTTLIRLLSFIGAYVLLYLYLKPLATYLQQSAELSYLLSYMAAGGGILVLGGLAISLTLRLLFGLLKLFLPWQPPSEEDKGSAKSPVGAILGGSLGAAFALFLIWSLSLLSVQFPQIQAKPEQTFDVRLVETSQDLMGSISAQLLQVVGAEKQEQAMVTAIMRNPVENAQRLKSIGSSDSFKRLMQDRNSLTLMRSGNSKALVQDRKFQAVMQEPAMKALVEESGLNSSDDQEELASTVSSAFTRMDRLRRDPKIQRILQDPELQRQVQNKDYFALFANPKFAEILEAFQNPEPSTDAPNEGALDGGNDEAGSSLDEKADYPEPSGKVYHWVDSDGRHHYSDKKPD